MMFNNKVTFPLSGTGVQREVGYDQPIGESYSRTLPIDFETLKIALLKDLREEAYVSFPSGDRARPAREAIVFPLKEQTIPLLVDPVEVPFDLWDICAVLMDTLSENQNKAFWFTREGGIVLEANLRRTLALNYYAL